MTTSAIPGLVPTPADGWPEAPPAEAGPTPVPGPKGAPLIGNTIDFQKRPLDFVMETAQAYGDLAKFRVATDDWYLVVKPEWAHDIDVRLASKFHKPRIAKRIWKIFLGNGLLSSDGEYWRRQQRMIRPAFHKARIEAYGETMVQYADDLAEEWRTTPSRDFCADMNALTLRVIAKTMFDADVKGDAAVVGAAMKVIEQVLVEHVNLPIPLPRWWPSPGNRRKIKAITDIEEIVLRTVDERRREGQDHGDLLSTLVFARDEAGMAMTDTELRDEAMTLVFAGHDTTAHALVWMWYLLAKHPEVADRVRDEITDTLGDAPLTVPDLKRLPYLDMVVKESMRILPSVWVHMREPIEDVPLGPYVLPKGCYAVLSQYVLHHDPRSWADPEVFRPERFSKENEASIPRGAYMPFAAGPRVCLGKQFALMEARLILGTLVRRARPTVRDGFHPEPVAQLSLHPKDGLPYDVEWWS